MNKVIGGLLLVATVAVAETVMPRVVEVFREFDHIAAQSPWPGFEPRRTAVEVFDGTDTYLWQHSQPPQEFKPFVGAQPGLFVFRGRHETVRANTGVIVNGVPTATADISQKGQESTAQLASLLIHETFHVYERKAHPNWGANEADLFTYPFDDPKALLERRLETLALVKALRGTNDQDAECWAQTALTERAERFGKLPTTNAAYERGTELNEGLAQYVEYKSINKAPALTTSDFPIDKIRDRGYATGQAFAILLDRFVPDWKSTIGDTPLDELLQSHLPKSNAKCSLPREEVESQLRRAQQEVAQLVATYHSQKERFLNARGWRIEIISGKEPLWPQGFDPLNVTNLGDGQVLHSRWVKLGNASGVIEVLNHDSLTESAGQHPLFNGVRELIVTGLPEPKVSKNGDSVTVEAPGVKGTLAADVEHSGQTLVLKIR
jgi:hypothetical protein